MRRVPLIVLFLSMTAFPALAEDIEHGRGIVESHCARCHATGAEGVSPLAKAPLFRTLGERYPIADLEEALAEGIVTGHPGMPEFSFEPDEVADVVAYIQSLQPK